MKVVAITDSVVSPIAEGASVVVLAPNAGVSLFPSVLPAMVVAHALASLMIAAGGAETLDADPEERGAVETVARLCRPLDAALGKHRRSGNRIGIHQQP